jgi:hypothetical protein
VGKAIGLKGTLKKDLYLCLPMCFRIGRQALEYIFIATAQLYWKGGTVIAIFVALFELEQVHSGHRVQVLTHRLNSTSGDT